MLSNVLSQTHRVSLQVPPSPTPQQNVLKSLTFLEPACCPFGQFSYTSFAAAGQKEPYQCLATIQVCHHSFLTSSQNPFVLRYQICQIRLGVQQLAQSRKLTLDASAEHSEELV